MPGPPVYGGERRDASRLREQQRENVGLVVVGMHQIDLTGLDQAS